MPSDDMRILFLAHRLPCPPDKGERIRAYHELKYLGERHEVDLFCFADTQQDAHKREQCQEICRSVYVEVLNKPLRLLRAVGNLVRGKPMSWGFFHSQKFGHRVQEALRKRHYDVIFVYCSSMGQFVPWPAPAPLVVDFVDADSAKWMQYALISRPPYSWLYTHEARAVAAFESALGRRATLSLATTSHDARELCAAAANDFKATVMPNGTEIPTGLPEAANLGIRKLQPFVTFIGTMNYRPNCDAVRHFAHDIYPLVRRRYPRLNFVIVGRNPDHSVRSLASIPGVTVTGAVPNVYEYFQRAEVAVAPFRISQGFHNKIAESLAMGTPVVTSSRAAAGVGLSEREGLFIAESPGEFADAIAFVLDHPQLHSSLQKSVPYVRKKLSWETQLQKLEELMMQVVAGGEPFPATIDSVAGNQR